MSSAQQVKRINDVLYYIHQDISRPLLAKELARIAAFSEQHFHRVFAPVVGEQVHQSVRRAKLEFSANQLMLDASSSVLDIATKAGFASVSSFSRAFKQHFSVSPGPWRCLKRPSSRQLHLHLLKLMDRASRSQRRCRARFIVRRNRAQTPSSR